MKKHIFSSLCAALLFSLAASTGATPLEDDYNSVMSSLIGDTEVAAIAEEAGTNEMASTSEAASPSEAADLASISVGDYVASPALWIGDLASYENDDTGFAACTVYSLNPLAGITAPRFESDSLPTNSPDTRLVCRAGNTGS